MPLLNSKTILCSSQCPPLCVCSHMLQLSTDQGRPALPLLHTREHLVHGHSRPPGPALFPNSSQPVKFLALKCCCDLHNHEIYINANDPSHHQSSSCPKGTTLFLHFILVVARDCEHEERTFVGDGKLCELASP